MRRSTKKKTVIQKSSEILCGSVLCCRTRLAIRRRLLFCGVYHLSGCAYHTEHFKSCLTAYFTDEKPLSHSAQAAILQVYVRLCVFDRALHFVFDGVFHVPFDGVLHVVFDGILHVVFDGVFHRVSESSSDFTLCLTVYFMSCLIAYFTSC